MTHPVGSITINGSRTHPESPPYSANSLRTESP